MGQRRELSCKGCDNRTLGCHSSCPKYAKYREEKDEARKQEDKSLAIGMYKQDAKKKYWRHKR